MSGADPADGAASLNLQYLVPGEIVIKAVLVSMHRQFVEPSLPARDNAMALLDGYVRSGRCTVPCVRPA